MTEINNSLLSQAIIYATNAHLEQKRKGTELPYIVHPLEVMQNLLVMDADIPLLCAGVLHDVVEDTDKTLEDIEQNFGQEIKSLVASHTETNKSLPWKERKVQALAHCAQATKAEQMLVLADKLSNIRAMCRDYAKVGVELWKRFNKGPKEQAWYYHGGVKALSKLATYPDTEASYTEFKELVYQLFGEPEAYINDSDLEEQEITVADNKETLVTVLISYGALTLNGEEFGSSDIGSDSYEYSIALDPQQTEKLLLQLRKEFGQELSLKEIFQKHICIDGRYFTFLRYCEKHQIKYLMDTF